MVQKITLEEELQKLPKLQLEDIQAVREWTKSQLHLINTDVCPDILLCQLLRRRYYSVGRTKQTVDNLLTFKTLAPEMCSNRSMTNPEVKMAMDTQYISVSEERDPDDNLVMFQFIHDPDARKYDFSVSLKTVLMVGEASVLENGTANGLTYVFDQSVYSLSHLIRISLSALKKATYLNKMSNIIFIKLALDSLDIITTRQNPNLHVVILNEEITALFVNNLVQITILNRSETNNLLKYIPRKIVPKDYGGDAESMEELHRKSVQLLERNEGHFKRMEMVGVDESKRIGPQKNHNTLFGLEGTFRQLNVD